MANLAVNKKVAQTTETLSVKEQQRLIALLETGDVETFNETRPAHGFELQRITIPAGTDLSEVDLHEVDLSQSCLKGVKLHRANLTSARLVAVDLMGAELTSVFADDANFSRADLRSVNASSGRFRRASFGNALLIEGVFEEADFTDAKVVSCRAEKACFVKADMGGVDLSRSSLMRASFLNAFLEAAKLIEARLSSSNFQNANLIGADFTKATGSKVSFNGACLHNAKMLGASFKEPNFQDAFVKGLVHTFGETKDEFFANAFVGKDADVTEFRSRRNQANASNLIGSIPNTDRVLLEQVEGRIANYIGLSQVKAEIDNMKWDIKLNELAKRLGEPTVDIKQHILMVGDPGTGKSSIGKEWGQVLRAYGYLQKGHLVYAPGRELVSGKVGQSEEKTREYIQRALDGVLFVDETHQLVSGSENDFGQYVMGTLIAAMTHYSDRLVVIFGCYPGRVNDVLNMDVGLDSRLTTWHFNSYDSGELMDIFNIMLRRGNMTCTAPFLATASVVTAMMKEVKGERFGNGRYIEDHLLKGAIKRQRSRLGQSGILELNDPSKQRSMLRSLTLEDLPVREHLGLTLNSLPTKDLEWINRENTTVGYQELGDYTGLHEGFPCLSAESHQRVKDFLAAKNLLHSDPND